MSESKEAIGYGVLAMSYELLANPKVKELSVEARGE
jgi:hypothetical protein